MMAGVFILVGMVLFVGHFFRQKHAEQDPGIPRQNEEQRSVILQPAAPLFISGWLPYWRKNEGVASLDGKMLLFNEINPFAFGVHSDGSIVDTLRIGSSPWTTLRAKADTAKATIIPTILWTDAPAMHATFSDMDRLNKHTDAIIALLAKENFSGVDIDYEGKDIADRDSFSVFLENIHTKLRTVGKSLSCTVEARTEDIPPEGLIGTRAMSFANDFSALARSCDTVRLMAYDEVFQIHRSNVFENANQAPSVPNADMAWVESVVRYALRYISPEKILLGVPTYGWEFQYEKRPQGYRYTRVKSVSYSEAIGEAQAARTVPVRDSGGEESFVYTVSGGNHIVTFSDAESVRQKIGLAKTYHLKGISLFKLDGLADPELFSILKESL